MSINMKRITILCFIAALVLAGGIFAAGRGTVAIRTQPVTGTVIVDGKSLGSAPLTLTMEGEHEISFSDYSLQYAAPPARKIRVGSGESLTIIGVYRNRFIPAIPPAGFSLPDSVFLYGTKERRLKDGTIFDYIDGGALVYLRHGLRETTHAVFRGAGKTTLTLDIYDLGSPDGAKAGFEDQEICPAESAPLSVGVPAKAYHYVPDYFLYFHKSNFLVYIATNNDSLKTAADSLAVTVAGNIP
jgi:hypothetical protein